VDDIPPPPPPPPPPQAVRLKLTAIAKLVRGNFMSAPRR